MPTQLASHILMVRPLAFGFNPETALDNHFQSHGILDAKNIQSKALKEFDGLVMALRDHGIRVTVVDDTADPHTPDSIFPNNWVSFHYDGTTVLYPMKATNRRLERRRDILDDLGRDPSKVIDLSNGEANHQFLEGTGSLVLDRSNRIAYACHSERTDSMLLNAWVERFDYKVCSFNAGQVIQGEMKPIYHTNVVMSVGEKAVVVCMEVITHAAERGHVADSILASGKQLIEISEQQLNSFAGNMLQLENRTGERFWVMSTQALESLNTEQCDSIQKSGKIIHCPLSTIESHGGGSARCMMAEIF